MANEKSSNILYYTIITYPLWDIIYTINYTILGIRLPINQFGRVMIMIYLATRIKNKKHILLLASLAIFLILGELTYITSERIDFIDDISYITKLCLLLTSIFAVESLLENNVINIPKLIRAIVLSSFIITISILLSSFGLGLQSWESGRSGVKGLFTAQNTATATLLIIAPLSMYLFYSTKEKKFFVSYLFILISLLMIGTKSGLVGALGILALQLLALFFKTKLSYLKIWVSIFSFIAILGVGLLTKDFFVRFLDQQKHIYESVNYGDNYSAFLLSNRNLQISALRAYSNIMYEKDPTLRFGMGYSKANLVVNERKTEFKSVEMDFYGIYYYSGIWVLIPISIILARRLLNSIKNLFVTKFSLGQFSIFLSIAVGLIHSYFGGHVLYEAMASLYFGSILTIARNQCLLLKETNQVEENTNYLILRNQELPL